MKFLFFGLQNYIFWAQGGLFSDLFIFSKFTESFQNLLSLLYQWEKLTTQPLHLYQICRVRTKVKSEPLKKEDLQTELLTPDLFRYQLKNEGRGAEFAGTFLLD